jgi:hypothetical protein
MLLCTQLNGVNLTSVIRLVEHSAPTGSNNLEDLMSITDLTHVSDEDTTPVYEKRNSAIFEIVWSILGVASFTLWITRDSVYPIHLVNGDELYTLSMNMGLVIRDAIGITLLIIFMLPAIIMAELRVIRSWIGDIKSNT